MDKLYYVTSKDTYMVKKTYQEAEDYARERALKEGMVQHITETIATATPPLEMVKIETV